MDAFCNTWISFTLIGECTAIAAVFSKRDFEIQIQNFACIISQGNLHKKKYFSFFYWDSDKYSELTYLD